MKVAGWDIGGAHLKWAVLDTEQGLVMAQQMPCPLWQGLPVLQAAFQRALATSKPHSIQQHVITMTGELADCFRHRRQGVQQILDCSEKNLAPSPISIYQLDGLFSSPAQARRQTSKVASANWHASATWLARQGYEGLLIDVGSTSCDLMPLSQGLAKTQGGNDKQRLQSGELLYHGVLRTPLAMLVSELPWQGRHCPVMKEHFATTGDVYRLLQQLPAGSDCLPAADQKQTYHPHAAARRLGRLFGQDSSIRSLAPWRQLAFALREQQLHSLAQAILRLLSRNDLQSLPRCLIGAGIGRFLIAELARRWQWEYQDLNRSLPPEAVHHLPAVAVAALFTKWPHPSGS